MLTAFLSGWVRSSLQAVIISGESFGTCENYTSFDASSVTMKKVGWLELSGKRFSHGEVL
jgi:hypothetical protein